MRRRKKVIDAKLLSYGIHCVMGDHDHYYAFQVTLEDPETGQQITWVMNADDAESRGNGFVEYAEKVRKHNENLASLRQKNA